MSNRPTAPVAPISRPVRRRMGSLAVALGLVVGGGRGVRAVEPAPSVLVLYSHSRLLPANVQFEAAFRESLSARGRGTIEVFEEFLDQPRFDGSGYLRAMESYLREKYASRPPAVMVVAAGEALRFLLDHRETLFAGVPIVHAAVDRSDLLSLGPLPRDVIGVPADFDFSGTIDQALRLQPATEHLVIVTGQAPRDRRQEERLRREARAFQGRVSVEHLAALPSDELSQRLSALGPRTVVFTPGYFEDGAGRSFVPRDSTRMMAEASRAPVYTVFGTIVGTGVVGGCVLGFERIGDEAGRETAELLRGVPPAAIELPGALPSVLHLDWRQVRRFGIDEGRIPAEAVVEFRAPSFLEEHRREAFGVAAVFSVQGGLIGLLLVERRRRRVAEVAQQRIRIELAHASRLAIAGELVGSIAHEINQPLAAILANADAAELILERGAERHGELRPILADIRRDDLRASEVIRRLRTLLGKREVERHPFDLGEAMCEVENLLRAEARRRGVTLEVRPGVTQVVMDGDRIQLQQVLINLILNGMDAVATNPEGRRPVVVSLDREPRGAALTVRDGGKGIAVEHMPRLFDSFFTTKPEGMGLGLAIARTIVEAHGGAIRVENDPGGGAVFHVGLPVSGLSGSPAGASA